MLVIPAKAGIQGRGGRSPQRESRGVSPLSRGLGDVPPVFKKISRGEDGGGRAGPPKVAMRISPFSLWERIEVRTSKALFAEERCP